MSENKDVFRKVDILLSSTDQNITLEEKPLDEVFKFRQPPYIIFGASGSGKTVLSLDLIYRYSGDCTNIYYVTSTPDNMQDDNRIGAIPQCYRRKPTVQNIINIWEEIIDQNTTISITPETLYGLISEAYEKDGTNIITELRRETDKILNEQISYYKSHTQTSSECSKYAKQDSLAFLYETVIAIIDDYIKQNGDSKFSVKSMNLIRSFYSRKTPKTMLIFDDITSELESFATSKVKVTYNGQTKTEKEAISSVFSDILTRGRHFNCLTCFFLHSIVWCMNEKNKYVNTVYLNESAAMNLLRCNIPDSTKEILRSSMSYVFKDGWHYMLYINMENASLTAVCKAKLHEPDEKIKLDKLNTNFIKACEDVNSHCLTSKFAEGNNITTGNSDDGEYEEEEIEQFI